MPSSPQQGAKPEAENVAREALKFVLSPQGSFFRDFLMTEIVQSIDALSRKQVAFSNLTLQPLLTSSMLSDTRQHTAELCRLFLKRNCVLFDTSQC